MELSPTWEAANCAATQEISSILWNPKVHCRAHKNPPLVPILSQMDPIHIIPSCLSNIHFYIVHPLTYVSKNMSGNINNKFLKAEADVDTILFSWLLRRENLRIWIAFCCKNWRLKL
jgi:hypothetical protein